MPGMDMVLAMLIGMAAGTIVHLLLGLILAPLVGMFETMMPASLIGMYGGMLFGMRDSMSAGSLTLASATVVGAIFGAIVVLGVNVYNRILRGAVIEVDN
jgi:large-conductance mechanosensitive channel